MVKILQHSTNLSDTGDSRDNYLREIAAGTGALALFRRWDPFFGA
jgi:hypothetical protein